MKKLLLSAGAFALAISAGAQTYFSDDFSSGNLNNWTLTDSDGDGEEWYIANFNDGVQDEHATSASWTSGSGPLTPDNWMVAGPFDLSTATTVSMTWKVYAQDQSWADEYYSAYAGTSSSPATLASSPVSFSETVGTSAAYMDRSLDLSSLAGQSAVYIAFRHHNCTDWFRINIDDVVVKEVQPDDAAVSALSIAPIVVAGNVNITGTVTNEGSNTINSFDLSWDDGSGPYTQTITQTIAPGGTYNFTHGTQLAAAVGNQYNIDVCVTLAGDGNNTNDCMSTSVGVVSSVPTKRTVGEEKTGTWCGWCPRGAVALAGMESTPEFIGVAVHNGDPMVVSSYDGNIDTYVPGGYPGGGVDRVEVGDPSNFSTMHAARVNEVAPANVSVSAVQNGSNMEVTVTANWVMTASGVNYRLGAIITEDDVIGTGASWNQVNYYDGGGSGNLIDPVSGFAWHTAGDPVSPADFGGYDHVARALGNNQIMGDAGSVPASITDGTSTSYTYTIPVGSNWELGKCHFIGILVDASTGEILNAASTSNYTSNNSGINEAEMNSSLSIYPNPVNDIANIKVTIEEAADVQIEVINALGQVVYSTATNNLPAGEYFYKVDVADFAAGIYTVRSTVNGVSQTSKLSVQ